MTVTQKPWGTYENLLEDEKTKVKKIVIKPGEKPSYQYHFKRNEVWVIVSGKGSLLLDDELSEVEAGSVVVVPAKVKHRITNTGQEDLIFIEVQTGEYFGEDDIVRLEDAYSRV